MMIAERLLLLFVDGAEVGVPVRISAPVAAAKDWSCHFAIHWPDGVRDDTVYGIDAVQALFLTMQMVGAQLYMSDAHSEGRLRWCEPGGGYGFPVPKAMRDELIGDDARVDGND
ncbi:DUF6968 family protein [Xanthobacter tagetidis]|uniref:DUF6968 domain-containing protein n=1 Tax=Xanthobacter tagetidis TaxID=60216 RepID=A0A3L7AG43_9HYPH|nr:hypothetical protein [Xanthobacter tagetidis]MBB6308619.1 hypothetical protein [Xanthobacter tagetidis]RLP78621.1 hypothetical protein D9R14_10130 [Xanthobacter tagetidis]